MAVLPVPLLPIFLPVKARAVDHLMRILLRSLLRLATSMRSVEALPSANQLEGLAPEPGTDPQQQRQTQRRVV